MKAMTRRQAVRTILRSAGGLWVVRYLTGCKTPDGGAAGDNGNRNDNAPDPALLRLASDDHVQGDAESANVIIQYGDFESAACGEFFLQNEPAVISELVETGQAAFIFRHFPQALLNPNARLAAIASECAVDFFEYHDLLFNNPSALTRDDLIGYAEQVGLAPTTFENCLSSGAKVPRVDCDVDSGTQLGVTETPTFFVNGQVLVGNRTLEDFQALLV
ncbi:MAG: thioredoxin domain-containing protein [Planctomycetota bacterium]